MKRRVVHLVPSVEEYAAYMAALVAEIGGWPLHPANRLTACGKRMTSILERGGICTETEARVTCKTCASVVQTRQAAREHAGTPS